MTLKSEESPSLPELACVFFDLDGTLVDTAPDLISSLNQALAMHGFPSADYDRIKPYISFGALAMIKKSLDNQVSESTVTLIHETMLNLYQNQMTAESRLYSGMACILASIEAKGLKWGVITNKRERFTQPLMTVLNLTERAACIISGDTAAKPKPHPEPMLEACKQAQVRPEACVFIGDAQHDIIAGKNVGMKTLAAVYGYLKPDDQPQTWGADAMITSPLQIHTWLKTALCH